jgi:lipoprotein NlpI
MKLTQAAQEFDRAVRLVPKEPEFRKLLGYARYLMGDFSGATAVFRSLTKAKGSASALLLFYLAAERAGEVAEPGIRSRLASHRGDGWTRCVLDFYLENRSPDDLLAAASKKLERGEAHYFIGCRQLMDKRYEEAVQSFRAAIDLCPQDVLEHIGARVELNRLNPEIPLGRDSLLAKGSDFAR